MSESNYSYTINDGSHLMQPTSEAMIALSTVALLAGAFQAVWHKRWSPYTLVCLSALCHLISSSIITNIFVGHGEFKSAIATSFFDAAFPILDWLIVFDTFRLALHKNEGRFWGVFNDQLIGTTLAYVWGVVMISCSIAFTCNLANLYKQIDLAEFHVTEVGVTEFDVIALARLLKLIALGLWAFAAFYLYQQWHSWHRTRRIFKSLVTLVFLVTLVTIGRTLGVALPVSSNGEYGYLGSSISEFVLCNLSSVIALYWATAFGHRWVADNNITVMSYAEQKC